ncbi:hypothetical protein [Bradyrhizobium zhanjiangense]|uniref:hypothetical protein n=1 Tax=Bradyrhizobium zhanjiangense TaxID=1325107 RepID=UPI001009B6CF|nr:hypothetical protein [Bradyrhizobium zhanjiangense]
MLLLIIGGVGMPNYVIGSLIISLPMQLTMPVMVHMPFDQLGLAAYALEAQHEVKLDRNVLRNRRLFDGRSASCPRP